MCTEKLCENNTHHQHCHQKYHRKISATIMPPSSRQALSFQEKDALRNFKHQHPEATNKPARLVLLKNFDKKITQSTISEILAYKKPRRVRNPNRQRESSSKYPELDPVLYECAIALQTSGSKLSFPFLQQLAYDTWPLVYGNREVPKISLGMMQRFATEIIFTFL